MTHGDGVYGAKSTIIPISGSSSERINDPAAFPCSHKQSSFVHTKAVDWWAFKTENPQTFALAMIPQAHGAVGGAGVQHMLKRLHFEDESVCACVCVCVCVWGGGGGGGGDLGGGGGLLKAFAMDNK